MIGENERIIPVNIESEMKSSYIDYSMSVIVSRALPDVRDGLKPVHRRVLYGMRELGLWANKSHKKSARIVGEVLGKYHPHGDSSVYLTMVRMAQEWSMRYPFVNGQGNFGSVDGDSPAAMRYTEAKLEKIAEETLRDIEKETVDYQLNFDDTLEEPSVLPTVVPNLLVNGASGIAVGMATNMPPHNLTDTIDAIVAYIDNPEIEIDELIQIIKAPDFPTGGIIYGYEGVEHAYKTGKGRVVLRAKTEIEQMSSGREKIVVTEIPYQVNKAELIKKIGELVNEKKIDGISYVNDESDRNGMRIVIDLKREAIAGVVLNTLYKYTALQNTFSVNNIALVNGRPQLLDLTGLISNFVKHRHDVVTRRTQYDLRKAKERAHILEGFLIALDNIDEVIAIIRGSQSPDEAKGKLTERFELSEEQAKAILDMRLHRLTGLEREKIQEEYNELMKLIDELNEILNNESKLMEVIKEELLNIKEKFGDERRTEITHSSHELNPEDFYADDEVAITISNLGYIKRTSLHEYKIQNRGGRGSRGGNTRDSDFLRYLYIATMHNNLLLFTKKGKCFWLKVYEIPEGTKTSKGRAIQNLIRIEPDDHVRAYIKVKSLKDEEYLENKYIVFATENGRVKKTSLSDFSRPRTGGINAITINEGDTLISAKLTDGEKDIMMAAKNGKAVRFREADIRPMGRGAAGVRGIRIGEDDKVVGMIHIDPDNGQSVLVVSENGYGKRTTIEDYRITKRGGKGVKTLNITEKTGNLIAIKNVNEIDDLMIITRGGIAIRLAVETIRLSGRATQGVRLINLQDEEQIASVARIDGSHSGDDEDDDELIEAEEVTDDTENTEEETDNNKE
jgi:DNA gyrase subunit A